MWYNHIQRMSQEYLSSNIYIPSVYYTRNKENNAIKAPFRVVILLLFQNCLMTGSLPNI